MKGQHEHELRSPMEVKTRDIGVKGTYVYTVEGGAAQETSSLN